MNKTKKIISIFLSVLIVISLASCTYTLESEIKSNGSIAVFNNFTLAEDELEPFYDSYYEIFNLPFTSDYDIKEKFPKTKEEFISQSDSEGLTKTVDGKNYYSFRLENIYTTDLKDLNDNVLPVGVGEFKKTEFWLYSIVGNESQYACAKSVIAEMKKLGVGAKMEYLIKMPYKIVKTNAEKVDDYTVRVSYEAKRVYATTEKSTADWTKASDIVNEVIKLAKKKLTPASFSLSVKYQNTKTIAVEWDPTGVKPDYFAKYTLQRKVDSGKWKDVKNIGTSSYSDKSVKAGKKYSYRLRAYVKTSDFTINSAWSKTKSLKFANFTAKPKIKVKAGKKKATVTIKNYDKNKTLKGYQIQYSNSKKFKSFKKVYTSKAKTVIKKLKKGKKYYFRVRKYTKDHDGDEIYGKFSKKVSVKIK